MDVSRCNQVQSTLIGLKEGAEYREKSNRKVVVRLTSFK